MRGEDRTRERAAATNLDGMRQRRHHDARRWRVGRGGALAISLSVATLAPLTIGSIRASAVDLCTTSAKGYVYDIYGNGLPGVTVAAGDPTNKCGGHATGTTDASGHYVVELPPTLTSDGATATLTGYTASTHAVFLLPSPASANDFALTYTLTASLSPGSVHTGRQITISAQTSAPEPSSTSGYVCAWGDNGWGELGNGTTASSTTPVQVSGLGGSGTLSGVTAIAAGFNRALALLSNGTVVAWGYGQLGNGTTTGSTTPVQVSGVGGSGTLSGVTAIAAGDHHSVALLSNGTVVAWGNNGDGELGNGTTTSSTTPVQVSGVGGSGTLSGVTAIAAGSNHSLALLSNGTVVAWGYNADGELGNGTTAESTTPAQVSGVGGSGALSGVTAIAAHDAGIAGGHSLALLSNGTVVAWGMNSSGELGNGTATSSTTPVPVSGVGGSGTLSAVTAIAGGSDHSLALLSDDTVVAWGDGGNGELGNGTTTSSTTPVQVSGAGGTGMLSWVTAIAAGGSRSIAPLSNGTVAAWGANAEGELGNGTTAQSTTPVHVVEANGVGLLSGVSAAAAGGLFTVARRQVPCTSSTSADTVIAQLPDASTVQLTQGTTSGGMTSWSGTFTPPLTEPEGTYTVKVCAVAPTITGNCDQAVAVGAPGIAAPVVQLTYSILNQPPMVDRDSIRPSDDGNTVFTSQPLMARITDPNGSVVDQNSIQFTLTDLAGGVSTYPASSYTGGWAKSNAATLTVGHVYKIAVTAADLAGNVSTVSQSIGFRVITEQPNPSSGSIPPTACRVSSSGGASKTATCIDVPVSLSQTQVTLGGAQDGPAEGFVEQQVDLSTAKISESVNGTNLPGVPAYQKNDPAWQPKTLSMPFAVPGASTTPIQYTVGAHQVDIGTLVVPLPPGWGDNATLSMQPSATAASTATCADPTSASPAFSCEPDPLQYGYHTLFNSTVTDPVASANAQVPTYNLALNETDLAPAGYKAYTPLPKLASIQADPAVSSVSRCAAPAVHSAGAGCVVEFTLNGVPANLAGPLVPSLKVVATDPANAIQRAASMTLTPFREVAVIAVPFGKKAPTEDLPTAQTGGAPGYLQALSDFRISQGAQPTAAPPATIFGTQASGIASVVNLYVNSATPTPTSIVEWVGEAGGRLWILRVTQDLSVNSPTAVAASNLVGMILWDRSSLPGVVSFASQGTTGTAEPPGVAGSPNWWGGQVCDKIHYGSGSNGWVSKPMTTWSATGLIACGPRRDGDGAPDVDVYFTDSSGNKINPGLPESEWECVELSKRWMYLAYGVVNYSANGNNIVDKYTGSALTKVMNGTHGVAVQPGDVLELSTEDAFGHTAVVTDTSIDANGNGTATIIEQNANASGHETWQVQNWFVNAGWIKVTKWLHSGQVTYPSSTGPSPANCVAGTSSTRQPTAPSGQQGYWLASSDGGVFTEGNGLGFYGSMGASHLNAPVVGIARTPDAGGYWLVAADGGVFAFGDAHFYGSMGGQALNACVIGMVATGDGGGYWLVAEDGGIFNFGDAGFFGSMGGSRLNKPVVGMTATPDAGGYWLLGQDGGIFNFGDAPYLGNALGISPTNFVGIAATGTRGYWMVNNNGQIYAFGDAVYQGGVGTSCQCASAFAATWGQGYWIVLSNSQVWAYGDAWNEGGWGPSNPVVGIATVP